jgi:hypothetical protein
VHVKNVVCSGQLTMTVHTCDQLTAPRLLREAKLEEARAEAEAVRTRQREEEERERTALAKAYLEQQDQDNKKSR